ncbi:uncharacterized protein VDAG_08688 [Verticillium dahliae VdLs.17]|uniref:Uncharacterized protein n=1 Tax=Verticillium dahliae (strain VdLs.17 / ATCC MYA-4575 / FGSC 10137) TaxID=498257 RepID=G2XEV3_VERDV|nr:uncharacterized protein VDAG_08688 [Verticillium dahliae VdLs.17]EGY18354.1 hypothetical protein VDAG_08688 [Verticillium dahliae VdLs.17]KAH6709755.1 hypothetical protein EV126DRAFT_455984 [Verticillium dahliae]
MTTTATLQASAGAGAAAPAAWTGTGTRQEDPASAPVPSPSVRSCRLCSSSRPLLRPLSSLFGPSWRPGAHSLNHGAGSMQQVMQQVKIGTHSDDLHSKVLLSDHSAASGRQGPSSYTGNLPTQGPDYGGWALGVRDEECNAMGIIEI